MQKCTVSVTVNDSVIDDDVSNRMTPGPDVVDMGLSRLRNGYPVTRGKKSIRSGKLTSNVDQQWLRRANDYAKSACPWQWQASLASD